MTDAKKKGARPFGWRNILNWTFAPGVALAVWFTTLNFLFEGQLDLYDVMEDIWEWLPMLFVSTTMGLAVGAAQSVALPLRLADFRRVWFWQTALGVGGGFFALYVLDEGFGMTDLLFADNPVEYLRQLVLFTVLAVPLLVMQSLHLRRIQHVYRGTEPAESGLLGRLAWVWPLPNILFLAVISVPDMDNGWWVAFSLLVWGAGMGLTLWWMLRDQRPSAKPAYSVGVQS